jgi:hypothetical protein
LISPSTTRYWPNTSKRHDISTNIEIGNTSKKTLATFTKDITVLNTPEQRTTEQIEHLKVGKL